jgi:hypothetical protein
MLLLTANVKIYAVGISSNGINIHTKFHEYWPIGSKIERGTHTQEAW